MDWTGMSIALLDNVTRLLVRLWNNSVLLVCTRTDSAMDAHK